MSKKCMIRREKQRTSLVAKFSAERDKLREIMKNPKASMAEKQKAQFALQALPRDSAKVRQRNRCALTGRPRGFMRQIGMGRNQFRLHAVSGDIPGLVMGRD